MSLSIDPSHHLGLDDLISFFQSGQSIALSSEAVSKIQTCRTYLDTSLDGEQGAIYGINTGFGSLCNTIIDSHQLEALQRNLLLSHACGMGDEVPAEIVRIMLVLKAIGLSKGHSGVQVETVQRLLDFYNHHITPVVYQQGSLGASGDLAPLSHLCLPILGEGEVYFKGVKMPASEALSIVGWKPIQLRSKEGLALINGTQFMSAYLFYLVWKGKETLQKAQHIAAMSIDAFLGRSEPFEALTHLVRGHSGQLWAAESIRHALAGSELQNEAKEHVQDPYSFRCIPQVHGASWDVLQYAQSVLEREINSVTDNPIVFPEEKRIISGGNFHGQPLALTLDFLALAIAEIGSISERRLYKLISGQRGLPAFLTPNPGLNSGFMIPQYTAAGIVSQNKQYCTPSSIDTIDSSNGQEDHVSMGANAATKCYKVLSNCQSVLAIEAFAGAQALDCRRPKKSSPAVEKLHASVREVVPFIGDDTYMHQGMMACKQLLF
jgi:histidine ammonia-lyase